MHSTDSKVGQITGIMSFPFSHKLFYFDHFVFFSEYDLQSTLCVGSELLSQRQLPGTFLSLPISSYKSPQCSLLFLSLSLSLSLSFFHFHSVLNNTKNTVSCCEKLSKLRAEGKVIWVMPKRKGALFVMSSLSSHLIIPCTMITMGKIRQK